MTVESLAMSTVELLADQVSSFRCYSCQSIMIARFDIEQVKSANKLLGIGF